jgi:hypothetical protein
MYALKTSSPAPNFPNRLFLVRSAFGWSVSSRPTTKFFTVKEAENAKEYLARPNPYVDDVFTATYRNCEIVKL